MKVNSGTYLQVSLNMLWDGGSRISLITFSEARDIGLVGEPIKISVIKAAGEKQQLLSNL